MRYALNKVFLCLNIHRNSKTQHLSLKERAIDFVEFGNIAASGEHGRTLFQAIRRHGEDTLLGISMLMSIEPQDPLFKGADIQTEWEIGYLADIRHQKQKIAIESIYHAILHAVGHHWGLKGLWASIEPVRQGSIAIAKKLGLNLTEEISAGSERVFYVDDAGNPAARNIYHTPVNWTLPVLRFKNPVE